MTLLAGQHPHSALVLERVAQSHGGQCAEPGCVRIGRYTLQIASWFAITPGILPRKTALCKPCAEAERDRWEELCGRRGVLISALSRLSRPAPAITEAIWYLRECGYSAEQIRDARHMIKGGVPAEEVAAILEQSIVVVVAA